MVGLALFVIFAGCPTFCTKVLYLIAIVFFFENYLIAIVLMNCTQRFCFTISEVVNNDCARLPLTGDVVVTEKVHTVNTHKKRVIASIIHE